MTQADLNAGGNVAAKVDFMMIVIAGVVLVLLAGFVTFIIQSFTATQEAYQELTEEIHAQNAKMDLIILQLTRNPDTYGNPTFLKAP